MTTRTSSEYYENPSLYGLRRSTRAHNPPERFVVEEASRSKYADYSSDSDSTSTQKTKKKPKTRKPKIKDDDFYEDYNDNVKSASEVEEEDEEDDDEAYASSKRARLKELAKSKKRRKLGSNSEEESSGVYTPPTRFSTRNNKVINYNIDHQDDDADLMETDDENGVDYNIQYESEQPAGAYSLFIFLFSSTNFFFFFLDSIDLVVDHRQIEGLLGRDPKNDIEYLVCFSIINFD